MAGIQVSGLLSNQAFDWKSVVDQLMEVEAIPIKKLETEKTTNEEKITAIGEVADALEALQDAAQTIRADNVFLERTVNSSDAGTTWRATSVSGAPLGSYKFEVQTLATPALLRGGADIGLPLNAASADLSGLTMNALPIATTMKAGTFTVAGKQITFAATDSLKSVLDQINTATGGDVTWSYDATADRITLTSGTGTLSLGAANDTSNFLQAMKLANNGTAVSTSSGALAGVIRTDTLTNARLRSAITAVDGTGAGSFTVNGVSIAYNVNSDTLNAVLDRITNSTAGVSAAYDAANDRVVLTNKVTGDIGVAVSEAAGGLLDALNLTSSATTPPMLQSGTNAKFRVNDGDWIENSTNVLDTATHGITGFGVTVNSTGTQTLTVASDTATMQTALQTFIEKFNAVQDVIEEKTKVTTRGVNVTASVLANNREIQAWASDLRKMAFAAVTGVTGSIDQFDDIGIDFNGTTNHLVIKDSTKLNTALATTPDAVQGFFSQGGNGMVPQIYGKLTSLMTNSSTQQDSIRAASLKIDEQISTMQTRLAAQRETLTNAFIRMLEAQSVAQQQNQSLTNSFFRDNKN